MTVRFLSLCLNRLWYKDAVMFPFILLFSFNHLEVVPLRLFKGKIWTFHSLHWLSTKTLNLLRTGGGGTEAGGTLLSSSFRLLAITPRRLLLSWLETRKGRAEYMRGVSRTLLVCDPTNVRGLEMETKSKKIYSTLLFKKSL